MTLDAFKLDPGKISSRQLMFIIITFIISTADIFLPNIVAQQAGRDSWISILIALAEALVVAAVAVALGLRFPRLTLVQISQKVLGKWLGWILAFIFVNAFFLSLFFLIVGEFGVIIKSSFLQQTPLIVLNGLLIIIAAYAVYQGIETIARVTEILMPLGIGVLFLVGLLVLPEVDINNYLPIMEEGIVPVINGSYRLVSFLGEGIIILMLIPYVNQPQKVPSTISWSMIILAAFLLIGVLAIGMFGPQQTANMTFPALQMVRRIQIGDFLEHLDAIIMTIWVGGIYIKSVIIYYICCIGYAQLFNVKHYRLLIPPIGIVVTAISIEYVSNIIGLIDYIANALPGQALIFEFLIPLLLLVVAAVRGIKEKDDTKSND
ncbi:MAG: hypothetical protein FH758_11820 [Firmicutes bacterium]|nr:hypothetical protein [Bacillota bacterium]